MDGGIGWGSTLLIFGMWSTCASCGLCGRSGIVARLRMWRLHEKTWLLYFSVHFLSGLGCGGLFIFFYFRFCSFFQYQLITVCNSLVKAMFTLVNII